MSSGGVVSKLIVDLVSVVLSWPVIFGAILIFFLVTYRDEIREFIAEAERVPVPGAGQLERRRVPPPDESKQEREEVQAKFTELEAELEAAQAADRRDEIIERYEELSENRKQMIDVLSARSNHWWLSYLSAYLRPANVELLMRIASREDGLSDNELEQDADYPLSVTVLAMESLIDRNQLLRRSVITDSGRAFLDHYSQTRAVLGLSRDES